MRGRAACLWLLAVGAALPVAAEPRSAIPWLSESIEIDRTPPPGRPQRPGQGPGSTAADPLGGEITVTTLGRMSRDAVGLLAPEETGFPRALWGSVPADEVARMILAQPDQGAPATRALFHRMLLAEADPPPGDAEGTEVLIARIDRLLEIGALEEARALIDKAGPDTPDLFRRWFDIGLLLDEAQEPCAALRQNPSLSPTLPARVFCLARGGDWNAAEITLTLGQQVGQIPPAQEALLARFLDPELFEEEAEEPPIPDPLTPLDYLMREAVGLPRPAGPLPLAFLHPELGEHVPMRQRVEAAERLVISGAVPPAVLFTAYRSGAPAASGGVWDRADAVQELDRALAEGGDVGAALVAADAALAPRGLRVALAEAMAPELAGIDPGALAPDGRRVLFELLLLARDTAAAAAAAGETPDARVAALLAVAGEPPATASPPAAPPTEPALAAALAGLGEPTPPDDRAARLVALVGAGQPGEAMLGALALLAPAEDDPPALRTALLTLVTAGQVESARAIALETLLAEPGT